MMLSLSFLNVRDYDMKNTSMKRYVYAVISFVMLLLLGIAYAWSIFVSPLENTYGWTRSQTSLAFTILMIGFSGGSLITGILAKKIGYRKVSFSAAILIGCGFFATAFTSNIVVLYVTYGIFVGAGIGMIYNSVISVIPLWFPEKKGMVTGVMLMGYALSTSILSPVCQKLLSEFGPKVTFLLFGGLDLIIFLAGSFVLNLPEDAGQGVLSEGKAATVDTNDADYTTREMLHTPVFYIYFLGANFLVMVALGYLNHAAPTLQGELGMSAAAAAGVVSAMSLCNGFARPLAGQFIDKKGIQSMLRILCLIYTAAALLAVFALFNHNTILMVLAVCLMLFGYGGQGASIPCVIRKLYGNQYFSMNYSIASMVSLTASICPSIVGRMQMKMGSYLPGFLLMAGFSIASIPFMFAVRRPEK